MLSRYRVAGSLAAAASLAAAVAPGVATAASPKAAYNARYCEVLAVRGTFPNDLVADIWGTQGVNDCPPALWKKQNAAALATELGALTVRLNGPRFSLLSKVVLKVAPGFGGKYRTFSGLKMRTIAQIKVPVTNGVPGLTPYTPAVATGSRVFTFGKEHKVYELTAPDGSVYVMQTYSQQVDRKLTLSGLPGLKNRLKPPAGWTFSSRKLKRDLTLTTKTQVTVLSDELDNTYQLERKG